MGAFDLATLGGLLVSIVRRHSDKPAVLGVFGCRLRN